MPPRNRDKGTSTWSIVVIVALIILIFALLYPAMVQLISMLATPAVNVSGNVKVTGFTAVPANVTFAGGGSSSTAHAGVDGSYYIMLRNWRIYNITASWTAAGGLVTGNCSAGSLNLHSSNATFSYNISC
jgi:hypothetical protein